VLTVAFAALATAFTAMLSEVIRELVLFFAHLYSTYTYVEHGIAFEKN
jgi:hypothetical protein